MDRCCLILEDLQKTQSYLADLVNQSLSPVKVIVAGSLNESLRRVKEIRENPLLNLEFCIVDLGLPDGTGVDFIARMKKESPDVRCVVATIYDNDQYLFQSLSAGAFGYLLKNDDAAVTVDALKRMLRDEPPLSPAIARKLLGHFASQPVRLEKNIHLSPRETETLSLLAKGFTVAEVAGQLGLSAQTVSGYVKTIYQKLYVSNRVELLREATKRGLV